MIVNKLTDDELYPRRCFALLRITGGWDASFYWELEDKNYFSSCKSANTESLAICYAAEGVIKGADVWQIIPLDNDSVPKIVYGGLEEAKDG